MLALSVERHTSAFKNVGYIVSSFVAWKLVSMVHVFKWQRQLPFT